MKLSYSNLADSYTLIYQHHVDDQIVKPFLRVDQILKRYFKRALYHLRGRGRRTSS